MLPVTRCGYTDLLGLKSRGRSVIEFSKHLVCLRLQLVLLTTATQRADGSLLPPPDSVGGQAVRIRRTILPLVKNGLVSEAEITDATIAWRQDGDVACGAFLTDAGRALIGVEPPAPAAALEEEAPVPPAPAPAAAEKKPTKAGMVLDLLRREQGATLCELIAATGWLPHTTRAALTGLRKKGHTLEKSKRGEATCYRAAEVA